MQLSLTQIEAAAVDGPADELLVRRLRDGDAAAGDVLVHRYHQQLLRYLQRLAGDSHMAEELHQATWLSALEHLESFVPSSANGGFKAWLFRIATNKAHDTWRSRGREKVAKNALTLMTAGEAADASNFTESQEQSERLKKAIDQLPENQRVVLLLRYYSQMKFVEIARVLGCPLNTALGRMHKAMEKLQELMED